MANRRDHIGGDGDTNSENSDDDAGLDEENVFEVEKIVGMNNIHSTTRYVGAVRKPLDLPGLGGGVYQEQKEAETHAREIEHEKKKNSQPKEVDVDDDGEVASTSTATAPIKSSTGMVAGATKNNSRFYQDLEKGKFNIFEGDIENESEKTERPVKDSAPPKSAHREITDVGTDFMAKLMKSQAKDVEQTEKTKKAGNLLKTSAQSQAQAQSTAATLMAKKAQHENVLAPAVRRSQLEPNEIRFEFRHYKPEDWISKEAYNSNKTIELTNVQFREFVKDGEYETLRRALNSKTTFNMEQCDSSGTTLLMLAAMAGFDDIVELLAMRGANINAVQRAGGTALMLAAEKGHTCVVAVLLGLGAHMDVQQVSGETALMKACRNGHRQIVQLLLEYGANYATVTLGDRSAMKLANQYNRSAIDVLLRDHSAKVLTAFETEVFLTLNQTADILSSLFPIHCFALNEGTVFKIHFTYQLAPSQSGVGMLLFIAHARITSQEIKCRFYGACAVVSVVLNGVKQRPLTEDANFVFSFCPIQNGKNEVIINTVPAIVSKSKLIVCAYKAQLGWGNVKCAGIEWQCGACAWIGSDRIGSDRIGSKECTKSNDEDVGQTESSGIGRSLPFDDRTEIAPDDDFFFFLSLDFARTAAHLPGQQQLRGEVERENVNLEGGQEENVPDHGHRVAVPDGYPVEAPRVYVAIHLGEIVDAGVDDGTERESGYAEHVELHAAQPVASDGRQAEQIERDRRLPQPFPAVGFRDFQLLHLQDEDIHPVQYVLQ
uniref:Uncharacterized protein n=1 Tax=Strigamia maritima TaxID=126957 RepID=T1J1H3_STRMM